MALAYPKIVHSGGTLTFTFPPTRVPAAEKEFVRHDSISTAGLRQSVFERVDDFLTLNISLVQAGADVAAWVAFVEKAGRGEQFAYYPDSTLSAFVVYELVDTDFNAEFMHRDRYRFAMRLRRALYVVVVPTQAAARLRAQSPTVVIA